MARLPALVALGLTLCFAAGASADKYLFSGEHVIRFSLNGAIREVSAVGTGVATVNESSGGSALHTLQLTQAFATIDQTVTDAIGVKEVRFDGVRINPSLAGPLGSPGVFAPIFTAAQSALMLTRNTLPALGTIGICNLAGCPDSIAISLNQTSGGVAIGPGVGGTFMITTDPGPGQVTVMGHRWTIGTTMVGYRTINGSTGFLTSMGFVQGPGTGTSTTLPSGMVQLVSGIQTTSMGLEGSNDLSGQIARLTLTFAPEPGLLLLLGAGAAGMVLLGRKRIRR